MGWMGKLVGGTIGFAIGGPLGAIFGAAFGHAFDSGAELDEKSGRQRLSTNEQHQLTFFVAAFSMLAKLVQTDGKVSPEEIDSIEGFMERDLRLTPQSRNVAVNIFRTALNAPGTFDDFAHQFHNRFHNQPQMQEVMIDILLRVAVSDGSMTASEENLILSAVKIFNFSQVRYEQLKSQYVQTADKAYAVLGCHPDDSDDQVKRCYRQRVQEYHPDKIAAKGLPDEFTRFAQDKFREIQDAWDQIKAARGIK
ncbi:co-chaperone protein DjlA [Desulfosarcina ovata subsp. sediminis]|uniref:Co-chaperone protein DjlA n=1 Tax=Desulfosarcina ovata subsp. sediminis TaxID=885957 RepID=A0A5K7ZJ60_9BACT|nr:co-chaperone DjlA [Desulfosarcina ovata]BBO79997.1 co-chaperone protein DjlA [Desulfosarcina ovata subsp. sediminis]